ncbi:MAG TPA: RNA polymerase factor sigma-54 [Thermodesulfobacteriaceae bacterium]|nr:RNA polymerase factor sigma-54 [Thermodesulfobacteriaceae bacterium]
MALELRQNLKLTQQLVMTPQLQQAIKLLQLSRIELIDTINQEMETNPVLEESTGEEFPAPEECGYGEADRKENSTADNETQPSLASSDDEKTPWEDKAVEEIDWKQVWEDDNRSVLPSYSFEHKEEANFDNVLTHSTDLSDHLTWQLQMSRLTDRERHIGCLIIGNLDQSGYLKTEVEEIAEEVGCSVQEVDEVLKTIQFFDPVGVASRDLRECLLIQIEHLEIEDPLVKILVNDHMPEIERHNYQAMAKATGHSMEEIAHAIEIITELDPRPGQSLNADQVQYIIPDIYVYKVDDEYVVTLNDEGLPRLTVSRFYRDSIRNGLASTDAKEFIQDKIKSALWLMRSIHQRQKTIFKVTQSIVKFQREFFDKGVSYLKPLVLRDVAEDVDMHESTISRVTTNKYVHTPRGIFELKFFFNAGLRRDGASDVATHSVKEKIRHLIQTENVHRPYSDKQVVEILAKDNIRIARRTVAKYRNLMGILPSSRRKRPKI